MCGFIVAFLAHHNSAVSVGVFMLLVSVCVLLSCSLSEMNKMSYDLSIRYRVACCQVQLWVFDVFLNAALALSWLQLAVFTCSTRTSGDSTPRGQFDWM